LAMLAAMRRASSRVFSLVADLEIEHKRRTANDQQGPVIDQINHRCAYISVSAPGHS
jgi:hypothetical protein